MAELDEYDIDEGVYRRVFVLRFWKFKFIVEVKDDEAEEE